MLNLEVNMCSLNYFLIHMARTRTPTRYKETERSTSYHPVLPEPTPRLEKQTSAHHPHANMEKHFKRSVFQVQWGYSQGKEGLVLKERGGQGGGCGQAHTKALVCWARPHSRQLDRAFSAERLARQARKAQAWPVEEKAERGRDEALIIVHTKVSRFHFLRQEHITKRLSNTSFMSSALSSQN